MTEREPTVDVAIEKQARELQSVLDRYRSERVVVLGGMCTGKSTLIQYLSGVHNMDFYVL